MERREAEELARRLSNEHPDRATHTWLPRETDDGWAVVKVAMPTGTKRDPLKATIEAKPRPPQSDDAPPWRSTNVPPYVGGG